MVNVDASCSDDVVPSLAFEESSAAADVSRSSAVSGLDEAIGSSIGTPEDPDDVWRLVGFEQQFFWDVIDPTHYVLLHRQLTAEVWKHILSQGAMIFLWLLATLVAKSISNHVEGYKVDLRRLGPMHAVKTLEHIVLDEVSLAYLEVVEEASCDPTIQLL